MITRLASFSTRQQLPEGEWSHSAVTLGHKTLRVYLNGEVVQEIPNLGGTLSATDLPLRLGADRVGSNRFVGLIDDVRLYRRALSADEIAEVMSPRPE